jgi:hypothetical protein
MSKMIFFDLEARNKMKKGVDTLANAVKVTLGPKGRNVVIEKKFGSPSVTKDGVSVAKEIDLEDPIENIGAQIINRITINCGNQKLQEYSGRYILTAAQRDFDSQKLALFNEMIGQTAELNDPGNFGGRTNTYPNAFYTPSPAGAHPSIMGRTLYIPMGAWFNLNTTQAFPLVSLQYNELQISVTFRPVNEWFTIRDVMDFANDYPVVAPNFNQSYMQFYRFIQTPPDELLGPGSYVDTRTLWNSNINLNCTYCFLSNDESDLFAKNEQKYLFKQIHEKPYYNVTGQSKIDIDSLGIVASWMFYFPFT